MQAKSNSIDLPYIHHLFDVGEAMVQFPLQLPKFPLIKTKETMNSITKQLFRVLFRYTLAWQLICSKKYSYTKEC